jgi:ketosteroid isomerase-like protein
MRQHHIAKIVFVFSLAIGSLSQPASARCLASPGNLSVAGGDAASAEQVRDCFYKFQEAWKARDMTFIRSFYAHDPNMLLFFERRQLRGWDKVETLYENMFAHALAGSVKSNYSNVDVMASGNMAYVAANFHLQVTNPEGEELTDEDLFGVLRSRVRGETKQARSCWLPRTISPHATFPGFPTW